MDLLDTLRMRRSVRAFLDESLSREQLESVLADARNAPSAINMQPWEVHMVLNEERKRLSRRLLKSFRERAIMCGPGAVQPIPDKFMSRARECADLMDPFVQRMGVDFKTFVNEGSLNFYGAPAVALIFVDSCFPEVRWVDAGIFLSYLILAAAGHGISCCPVGLVKSYEDEIKDHLNIPDQKTFLISLALGKPDSQGAINEFKSPRIGLDQFVRWIE